jgi:hypothetical protein
MLYPSSFFAQKSGYVTQNLVIDLDAMNPSSYPGFGDVWYDLTGRGNNANLFNGVRWNSSGYFYLDGANDYISVTNTPDLDFPGDFTLELVFVMNPWLNSVWDDGPGFHGWGTMYRRYDNGYSLPGAWSCETAGDDIFCSVWEGPGPNFGKSLFGGGAEHTRRRWNHIIWTRTGTSMKMYQNGKLCSSITESYDLSSEYNLVLGRFSEGVYGFNHYMSFRIYQKGFNDKEVLQNYNFNKSRFLLKNNNIANGLESKAYNFVGNPTRVSSAKYPTDEITGTVRRNYTKAIDNFKEQIDGIKQNTAASKAIQNLNIANDKKAYSSNLNQESMNSVMNQLEVINKMSQKLYQDILLLKSQSITKNGIYPSSKYR